MKMTEYLNGTEFYNEVKEEATAVEKELKELYEDLKATTVQTNVKLYDVASLEEFDPDMFYDFCEFYFEEFKELLNLNDLYLKHVGRTSWFYIISDRLLKVYKNNLDSDYDGYKTFDSFIGELFNVVDLPEFFEYDSLDDYLDVMEDAGEDMEDILYTVLDEIKFFRKNWHDDLKEELRAIKEAYKHLEDFKANQVKIYSEYVTDYLIYSV